MVAGLLSGCGYFMGDDLYPARESNPKGFFEAPEINGINEDLLATVVPGRPPALGWCFRHRPRRGQRWLADVPVGTKFSPNAELESRISELATREPYCFKDPRFSYTLDVWRPYLKDVLYLCVFRDPASTAASILKECATMPYLRDLKMDRTRCLLVWTLVYRHILETHRAQGDWMFVHFDQVVTGEALDEIEKRLDAKVDRGFPDGRLKRSTSTEIASQEALEIYAQLCRLARYETVRGPAR